LIFTLIKVAIYMVILAICWRLSKKMESLLKLTVSARLVGFSGVEKMEQ